MKKEVYFMVKNPERSGYLFVDEIQDDFEDLSNTSFSLMCLEDKQVNNQESITNETTYIKAVLNREEKEYPLIECNDSKNVYVDVPSIGKFYFEKVNVHWKNNKCSGIPDKRLMELVPINVDLFEEACLKYNFFFIGSNRLKIS